MFGLFALALGFPGAHGGAPALSPLDDGERGALGTYVRGPRRLVPGTAAALRVSTHLAPAPDRSRPVGDVEIEVLLRGIERGRTASLFRGRTDAAGLVDAFFEVPPWPAGRYALIVSSRRGAASSSVTQVVDLQRGARLLLQSDKPLYQPGQTVHLRALGLRAQDGRPLDGRGGARVRFEITDPRGNRVLEAERPVSEFGVASIDAPLAQEILLGDYRVRGQLQGDDAEPAELSVEVARYVLPRFQVTLDPDRGYYNPGARALLSVRAAYFHGKPVAGGEVTVRATLHGSSLATLRGALDDKGRARLELPLPSAPPGKPDEAAEAQDDGDRALRLDAQVVDAAGHAERAARELIVAAQPIALEIVAEAGDLLPGLQNDVFVVATHPDGSPAAGAKVALSMGQAQGETRGTDALGVATFSLRPPMVPAGAARPVRPTRPPPDASACSTGEILLRASLTDRRGEAAGRRRCFKVAATAGLLLRTDRSIYRRGEPIRVRLQAPGLSGTAFIDVVKDRQIVSTAAAPIKEGVGEAVLEPDERRHGTLALQAYHLGPDGRRSADMRMIYVERRDALNIEVHRQLPAGQDAFRPGETGRLRLRVLDAATGAGVRASLGLVMVDEALLALRPLRPGATRAFATLAAEARRPGQGMKVRPAGRTIDQLVEGDDGPGQEAARQEAARILLAGAAPPWDLGWENDPFALRKEAMARLEERLRGALQRYLRTHVIGERDPADRRTWRYRQDLVQVMIRDGALRQADARDPWERQLTAADLVRVAGLAPFPQLAGEELNDRLTAIYTALLKDWDRGKGRLPSDSAEPARNATAAAVITLADLRRLAEEGRLPHGRLYDPWGTALRVIERRRPVTIAGLRSRFVVASAGPDGAFGNDDDLYAMEGGCPSPSCRQEGISVVGAPASEAFATLRGLCGCGYGYGGGASAGHLASRAVRPVAVMMGQAKTLGVAGKEDRARSNFPETLLWLPEIITSPDGAADIDVAMADSVTTWRLHAEAIAADGRLGQVGAAVRVFQDFFIDLDLPQALTQHDEISVPVAVHNYLKAPQRVTIEVEDAPWFTRLSAPAQVIDLAPAEVGVRHLRLRVTGVGQGRLRVRARGQGAADLIERATEIAPDGEERLISRQDRLGAAPASLVVDIPPDAIEGATSVSLKVYPGTAAHVLEGLESLLKVPSGCFEQTSSTTYPNALILQYLRRTGKITPAIEARALGYLHAGYQRLLSFEVRSGGFSWFGESPASQVLTAYGLEEFHDMAKVMPVDRRVIERTQRWLLSRQRPDGGFAPDTHVINDGVTNGLSADEARATAFIAASLQRSGVSGPPIDRARAYVQRAVEARPELRRDPFLLALLAELSRGAQRADLGSRLWATRQARQGKPWFASAARTPTHGGGTAAAVETTALAARAFMLVPGQAEQADQAIGALVAAKDTLGNWHSTQATIRTLQALLLHVTGRAEARGVLQVSMDGGQATEVKIGGDEGMQVLDLREARRPGAHQVALRYKGTGQVSYQLVGRHYVPRARAQDDKADKGDGAAQALRVRTVFPVREVAVGGEITAQVEVRADGEALEMPMVTAGLPPGFALDEGALAALVRARRVEKFQVSPREVVFYLRRLQAGAALSLPLRLEARAPGRVQAPPPTVYEYYQPERRAQGEPVVLTAK